MVKKFLGTFLGFLFFLFSIITGFSQDGNFQGTPIAYGKPEKQGINFSISFYNKKVYFLGDDIWIEAVISNNSIKSFHFKIAENRYYSLDFSVKTVTNIVLNHSESFLIARSSNEPVFFREITLDPGEKYGILVKLNDFIRFSKPDQYIVKGAFYPLLFEGNNPPYYLSNRLILDIRPALKTGKERELTNLTTGEPITREPIPPDEVVSFTLRARQKGQWNRFFLYLNLEELLKRNPRRKLIYQKLSEEDRRRMLAKFREELEKKVVDKDILVIPSEFRIVKTEYTPFEGTVEVIEKFKYSDYTEVKKYTYYLRRKDRYWMIINYEIQNLGTE